MKCWITLTSHSGTVNAGHDLWSNEGRLLWTKLKLTSAMSFRSMDMEISAFCAYCPSCPSGAPQLLNARVSLWL